MLRSNAVCEAMWVGKGARALTLGLLALMATLMLFFVAVEPAHADSFEVFTVNSTADTDDGACSSRSFLGFECTLREAINVANRDGPDLDLIHFAIPGTGPHTIKPASQLPAITQPAFIDGCTQGDSTSTISDDALCRSISTHVLKIELDGSTASGGANGLVVNSGNVGIQGLVINRFREGSTPGGKGNGILVNSSSANEINIVSNYIGTDPTGTVAEPNDGSGVLVAGTKSRFTNIGSSLAFPFAGNLISGNGRFGVSIGSFDVPANFTQIVDNFIGTDKSGTRDLGNVLEGISITGGSDTAIASNTIAFNGAFNRRGGIAIHFGSSIRNRIFENSIFSNDGLGIDLNADGPNKNDALDADTGPNNLQNKPVLSSATTFKTTTTVEGRLNSKPNQTFTIEFFSNPSGNEGKTFIGSKSVSTNDNGIATFTVTPFQAVAAGQTVTATATGAEGTSEFSPPKAVVSSASSGKAMPTQKPCSATAGAQNEGRGARFEERGSGVCWLVYPESRR